MNATIAPTNDLLTVSDVAKRLHMREQSIYNWITLGFGPRSFKIGRRRFYDARDVDAWILEQKLASA